MNLKVMLQQSPKSLGIFLHYQFIFSTMRRIPRVYVGKFILKTVPNNQVTIYNKQNKARNNTASGCLLSVDNKYRFENKFQSFKYYGFYVCQLRQKSDLSFVGISFRKLLDINFRSQKIPSNV